MATPPAPKPSNGTWIVGGMLLVFLGGIFVFAPTELPDYKQRLLAFFCAFLAGVFSFLFTGDMSVRWDLASTKMGKFGLKAGGGFAAFVVVLAWWYSPAAPISPVKPGQVSALVKYTLAWDPSDGLPGQRTLLPFPTDMFVTGSTLQIVGWPLGSEKIKSGWLLKLPHNALIHTTSSTITAKNAEIRITVDGPSQNPTHTFAAFTSSSDKMASLSTWKRACFVAILSINDHTNEVEEWFNYVRKVISQYNGYRDQFFRFYGQETKEHEEHDMYFSAFPVHADLYIFVDGERVAVLTGILARVTRHDEDVNKPYIVVFNKNSPERTECT